MTVTCYRHEYVKFSKAFKSVRKASGAFQTSKWWHFGSPYKSIVVSDFFFFWEIRDCYQPEDEKNLVSIIPFNFFHSFLHIGGLSNNCQWKGQNKLGFQASEAFHVFKK